MQNMIPPNAKVKGKKKKKGNYRRFLFAAAADNFSEFRSWSDYERDDTWPPLNVWL